MLNNLYRLICILYYTTDETIIIITTYYITCDRVAVIIVPAQDPYTHIYNTYAYIVSIDSVSERRHCHGRRRAGTLFKIEIKKKILLLLPI